MNSSAAPERQRAAPGPERPRFQFSLRTLLLLVVVLASSLAVFGAWGIVVFALAVGLAICLHVVESLRSQVYPALVVLGLMALLWLLIVWPVQLDVGPRYRRSCLNNLKQIALALQTYHQANGCFPPAYTADKNGKPLHSWRVLILPYLDYDTLYKRCDLTQPWDSPKNKKLLPFHMREFVCPSDASSNVPGATQTNYFAVVGANTAWAGEKPRKLADFGQDAAHTILVVEVADSGIPWAEPRDLSLESLGAVNAESPALTVSSHHIHREEFFYIYDRDPFISVALADGSVNVLRTAGLSTEDLRKVLQISGFKEGELGVALTTGHYPRRLNWPNIAALAVWLLSVGTLLTQAVRTRRALPAPATRPSH